MKSDVRDALMTDPRCVFALVRSITDLERAGAEIAAFLSMRQRTNPPCSADTLTGIWIDPPEMVANIPSA